MSRAPYLNLVFLFLAVVLVVASVVAYSSGGPAQAVGHSSDEINFILENYTSASSNCTAGASSLCTAFCPVPPSGSYFTYHVVSGGCISADAWRMRQAGECTGANCSVANPSDGWRCQDSSHAPGQEFIAYVNCLKGGQ